MTAALVPDLSAGMTPPPPALLPQSADRQLLAALPSAVGCARRFVHYTLKRWRLFALIDIAESVAGELVTDAVSATGIVVEHPSYLDLYDKQLNLVHMGLHLAGAQVVIQVWDADPTPPWPREPAPEQARSRNFYLPPHGGKVVWVALEIPPAVLLEGSQQPALPRRAAYPRRPVPPAPAHPVNAMTDPLLLGRVRDGLHRLDTGEPPGDGPNAHDIAREDR